jgi:predicted Rossmann-fold nucleotide-binding protein
MREISSDADLRAYLAGPPVPGDEVAIQSLALTRADVEQLLRRRLAGVYLFGCEADAAALGRLAAAGATVFPRLGDLPFDPYRSALYTPADLFTGFVADDPCTYCETPDARTYAYWRATGGPRADSIVTALARRLHDHSISDALVEFLAVDGRAERAVAVMGGHDLLRTDPRYRDIAGLSRALTRAGFLMVSGGGPGAMEATHLGAWMAAAPDDRLDAAFRVLADAPRYDDEQFVSAAFRVQAAGADVTPGVSLSIPTWLYGHEPPTIFATHVAKYFDNSVREDGLVSVARRGIVFAPGHGGTVQELFQDAAQNQYFALGEASPMVLLDEQFWTEATPAWPLLDAMRRDTEWGRLVALVDTPEEAIAHLRSHHPLAATNEPWSFCAVHCGRPPSGTTTFGRRL